MAADAPPALTLACYDPPAFIATAKARYGEVPAEVGVAANGWLSILFLDPQDNSWTLALQQPGGKMCFVAGGDSWSAISAAPGAPA